MTDSSLVAWTVVNDVTLRCSAYELSLTEFNNSQDGKHFLATISGCFLF